MLHPAKASQTLEKKLERGGPRDEADDPRQSADQPKRRRFDLRKEQLGKAYTGEFTA
jgi:hypothetical protein